MSTELIKQTKLCRLCAGYAENCGSNCLFDKNNKFLIQQICELTGLRLKDVPRQMLPRYICASCTQELPRAYEFRKKIIETQCYFKSEEHQNKYKEVDDVKPMFAFVQLNEGEIDDTTSLSDNSDESRDYDTIATELVEYVVKEKEIDFKPQTNQDKATNGSNIKSNEKRKSHRLKALHTTYIESKAENFEIASENGTNENVKKNVYTKNFDDYAISEESSSEDGASCRDSRDPDFAVKLEIPKKAQTNNTNDKAKEVIWKNRPFKCYLCQDLLDNLTCLKIHFRKRHKGEKFKCDLCDEKFCTAKSLVSHFLLHNGEKEFKCRYCDVRFHHMSTRVRHERREHSKDSAFLCFICGKSFITTYLGRQHMTVHTKERAFHCTACNASFLTKTHLRTHYRSITHKNNEQKLNQTLSTTTNATDCHRNVIV